MILTITPNPAFDRIQTVPGFQPGRVCRGTTLTLSAAGKGVNVARAIRCLGGKSLCTGLLGGHTGRMLAEFTAREGIPAEWIWINGESRVTQVILTPETGDVTVVNEAGPAVTVDEWNRLQTAVLALAAGADAVTLSGSLPPGLPPDLMPPLIEALNRNNRRVFVDQGGAWLQASLTARPEVVKINSLEAASLLGWSEFDDAATAARAAQSIRTGGITTVALTLGARGAVLAGRHGIWLATPPALKIVSPIGSGDAFLAGLTLAMMDGQPDPESLRQAVAAGSANALSDASGSFSRRDFEQILTGITLASLG